MRVSTSWAGASSVAPGGVGQTNGTVYSYASNKALGSVVEKVRSLTRRRKHRTLVDLLRRLNPVLRRWCNYFCRGVSSDAFDYLDYYAFWRVVGWLRKRHPKLNWGTVQRRFLPGWEVREGQVEMFRPRKLAVSRYRYRGTRIPTPWASEEAGAPAASA